MNAKDPNFSEDQYILHALASYRLDLQTGKDKDQMIDNYACMLTAYMRGQQSVSIKKQPFEAWLASEFPSLDLNDEENKWTINFMKQAYEA